MKTVDPLELELKATVIHPSGCQPNSGTLQEHYALNRAISLAPIQSLLIQPVEPVKFHMGIFQRALSVSRHFSFTDESTESARGEFKSLIYTKIPSYSMKSQERVSHSHDAIQT